MADARVASLTITAAIAAAGATTIPAARLASSLSRLIGAVAATIAQGAGFSPPIVFPGIRHVVLSCLLTGRCKTTATRESRTQGLFARLA